MLFISVAFGAMTGGKSTFLYNKYRQISKNKNKKILVVKHSLDTRFDPNCICTYTGSKIPCIPITNLTDINVSQWDVVIIDEAQWFTDLKTFIESNLHLECEIYMAGLISDKDQKKFGQLQDIFHLCSEFHPFDSICEICGKKTYFQCERSYDTIGIHNTELSPVGGMEKYENRCNDHIHKKPNT